jgi:hypothetical protein
MSSSCLTRNYAWMNWQPYKTKWPNCCVQRRKNKRTNPNLLA